MKKSIFTMLTLAFIGLSTANAQVGVGTNTPNASAALEVQSTTQGFLPPRMTEADRQNINNPATGLMIYCADCGADGELQVYNGTVWTNSVGDSAAAGPPPIPTVIGADGKEWMDRNLGATQVATAFNDMESYGDLYQWGRAADGHQLRSNTCPTDCYAVHLADGSEGVSTSVPNDGNPWDGKFIRRADGRRDWLAIQDDSLWLGVDGDNNPCPTGFRVPTEADWIAVSGPGTVIDWNGANDAYNSPLKLPAAGKRRPSDGSLRNVGTFGGYWSSTVSADKAKSLLFNSTASFMGTDDRARGYSVRCIKD